MCNADRNALDLSGSTLRFHLQLPAHQPQRRPTRPSIAFPHRRPTVRCAQIPIAQAAHPPFPHRGFPLFWRISYAGPGARRTVRSGRHPKSFTSAAVPAASPDRPLLLQLQASCCIAANCGSGPTGDLVCSVVLKLARPVTYASQDHCVLKGERPTIEHGGGRRCNAS
jgi:hypothetical protein